MAYKDTSWWNDGASWDDEESSYGVSSYYRSRWKGYKEKLSSWKSDKDGNVVFPQISWDDNDIIEDKKQTQTEKDYGFKADDIIPGFVGGDLFRLLYHEDPQLTKPENNEKEVWMDALSSLPIYGLAMQTNKSRFWSKIATEAIVDAIFEELVENGTMNPQPGESRGQTIDRISKAVSDAMDGKGKKGKDQDQTFVERALDKGLKGAQDKINKTRMFVDELGIDPEMKDGKEAGDGKIIERLLTERGGLMDKFFFNAEAACEFLKATQNFFNSAIGRQRLFQDDFLHSDNFSEIINPELFEFPFELPNINVMTSKRTTQIDLYLDVSGSMGSALSKQVKGTAQLSSLKLIDAVAIFAFKLWKKGIVRNVYKFNYTIEQIDPSTVLFISPGGGTCFTTVVTHYQEERKKGAKTLAFILTDGCDDTSVYHKDAYWMFIEGGPYNEMARLYPETQMRIWSRGQIKKISEWNPTLMEVS